MKGHDMDHIRPDFNGNRSSASWLIPLNIEFHIHILFFFYKFQFRELIDCIWWTNDTIEKRWKWLLQTYFYNVYTTYNLISLLKRRSKQCWKIKKDWPRKEKICQIIELQMEVN